MRKLAVLTAFVFLFGMGSFAMAEVPAPCCEQTNNNDLVGAAKGGANVNDSSGVNQTTTTTKDNLNGNSLLSGNTATETTSVDKSAGAGQSAATTGGTAVGLKDSANGNSLLSGNKSAEDSFNKSTEDSFNKSTKIEVESKASKGSASTNIGDATVIDKQFNVEVDARNLHVAGEVAGSPNSSVTLGKSAVNGSNSISAEAEEGAQQAIGGGSNTMNKADDGGIVATGTGAPTVNMAKEGGVNNTGSGNVNSVKASGKYAPVGSNQTVNEYNNDAEKGSNAGNYNAIVEASKGSIATTTGNVAKEGGIAMAPGSAVSTTELRGSVKENEVSFEFGGVKTITKSGSTGSSKAYGGNAKAKDANSKAESEGGFALSGSASKAVGAGAGALGGSTSGAGAGALGGALSGAETGGALATESVPGGSANADADAKSKALSANGALAGSKAVSENEAQAENNSESNSTANANGGQASSGKAINKAIGGDAQSGQTGGSGTANGASASQANIISTGNNNFAFSGNFNGIQGAVIQTTGYNNMIQAPISINAVVGGSVAGK